MCARARPWPNPHPLFPPHSLVSHLVHGVDGDGRPPPGRAAPNAGLDGALAKVDLPTRRRRHPLGPYAGQLPGVRKRYVFPPRTSKTVKPGLGCVLCACRLSGCVPACLNGVISVWHVINTVSLYCLGGYYFYEYPRAWPTLPALPRSTTGHSTSPQSQHCKSFPETNTASLQNRVGLEHRSRQRQRQTYCVV